jgi:RNA polymerase sigma factor (sigma-70 family)
MTMSNLEHLAQRATDGDRTALEALLFAVRDDVYRLALRMLGHPQDAEDATQEILVKVATHLGSFQGKSRLRTWVFRLASNHVLNFRRGRREMFSFEMMSELIEKGSAIPEPTTPTAIELAEEVKLGCTQGMVLALDRDHRLAYVLVDLFELSSEEAAEALEIEPAALRKRVSRARQRLAEFMTQHCGLVDEQKPCRCTKMSVLTTQLGILDPNSLLWKVHPARPRAAAKEALRAEVETMDALIARAFEVQRSHPDYVAPESVSERIRDLIQGSKSGILNA